MTLSSRLVTAMNAETTGESLAFLVTIDHANLDAPFRFTDQSQRLSSDPLSYGIVSRSNIFDYLPIRLKFPEDKDGVPSRVQLEIDNIDRSLVALVRSERTPATALIELVLEETPDTAEVSLPDFDVVSADYDATVVRLELFLSNLNQVGFPKDKFSPAKTPALF
jgi:hypothetical protein